jgi:hypothetical protein
MRERHAGEIRVMSFAPLLEAAPAIPLHAFAAMTAFVLGVVQFAAPKCLSEEFLKDMNHM